MQQNADQNNSEYEHFSRSVYKSVTLANSHFAPRIKIVNLIFFSMYEFIQKNLYFPHSHLTLQKLLIRATLS